MLRLFNSFSGQKETFQPIEPGKVRLYVCGMTVYDYCHIGHARVMVVFDVITRYLRESGFAVTHVRNVTDIDDKIIKRANELGVSIDELTNRFIAAMHDDAAQLGVIPPDLEPRATQSIEQIVALIAVLMEKGYAYQGKNGDIYYDVSHFDHYGELSGKQLEDLRAGARIEVDENKDDPLDFVLWKAAKPGEPSWPSSWGAGRPGWHIECSAMAIDTLGEHFDMHGGGMDLKFPHHENEIAQSEAATGHKFVNYWLHNGFVQINDEKMSKSLGNFFTVREVLKHYQPEVVRYFILGSHYRSPLNYSQENLEQARAALERLYTALRGVTPATAAAVTDDAYRARFANAMNDDFNVPEAFSVLFDLARDINRHKAEGNSEAAQIGALELRKLGAVLGLLQSEPEQFLKGQASVTGLSDEQIEQFIAQRNEARKTRIWQEADRIRDELKAAGVLLEDGPNNTTSWRRG